MDAYDVWAGVGVYKVVRGTTRKYGLFITAQGLEEYRLKLGPDAEVSRIPEDKQAKAMKRLMAAGKH